MKDIIKEITQKDNKLAYEKTKEIIDKSKLSNQYYSYLDDFALLLNDKKTYIRTRAFLLCCYQARWDNGKLDEILPLMLKLFDDSKPTVVKQCLDAIKEVAIYCPKLCPLVLKSLENIDLTKYKDTIAPLIKKDIESLNELISKQLHNC